MRYRFVGGTFPPRKHFRSWENEAPGFCHPKQT
jgi:hypothetical protein